MEIKPAMVAIAAFVVITVIAAVLMPVLDDATTTEVKFTNKSYYTLDKADADSDVTLIWKVATPNVISVNGTDVSLADLPTGRSYTIIGSESVMIRYTVSGGVTYLEVLGSTYINSNTGSALTTVTMTISGDTLSYLDDRATPVSKSYTLTGDVYYISADGSGEYAEVMKDANTPAYVKGDSDIHMIGSTIGAVIIGVYGEGNLDDGMTLSTVYKSDSVTTDVTYSDPVATTTSVSGYKDLYLLEKFEFTMSYNTDQTMNATYTYFIVPAEVTAEKAVHLSDSENAILLVIPALVIIAILVGVLAVAFRGRE